MKIQRRKMSRAAKRTVCMLLILLSLFAPMTSSLSGSGLLGDSMVAEAASKTTGCYVYFRRYTGKSNSLVDALKAIKADSSYDFRKYIASKNGIQNYKGTAAQNTKLLNLLKQGKLRDYWAIESPSNTLYVSKNPKSVTVFGIKFRGSGIASVSYKSNNTNRLTIRGSTKWNSTGAWCITTITAQGKAWGSASISYTLNGGYCMNYAKKTVTINTYVTPW